MIRTVLSDFFGLARVCGLGVALRWLVKIITNLSGCARARNLQPADAAMGPGPFDVRLRSARAKVYGEQAISGIREMWVRDVYLGGGSLRIPPDGTVVDLGANMGNFTVLAMGHGPGVRVVSVEGDPRAIEKFRANLAANGWSQRAQLCTQFIGGETAAQQQLASEIGGGGPAFISEEEFVRRYNLSKIDLLKCDIEGSEFGLLTPQSRLLAMAEQLAIELHDWGGSVEQFKRMLASGGFEYRVTHEAADGCVLQAWRTRATK